ncbi:MAG: hypothetical protein AB1Z63_08870, partial [Candidatus Limnocylindrales bacterium]
PNLIDPSRFTPTSLASAVYGWSRTVLSPVSVVSTPAVLPPELDCDAWTTPHAWSTPPSGHLSGWGSFDDARTAGRRDPAPDRVRPRVAPAWNGVVAGDLPSNGPRADI